MEIRILERAKADLRFGWQFYENSLTGLGSYFLNSIDADVKSLLLYAGVHEIVNGFHRLPAKRFPFAIYYLVENNCINVYAILDCRNDPHGNIKRLELSMTGR